MPKPSDFYVGVLDFFAILLPGGVSAAILEPSFGQNILGPLISNPSSSGGKWAIFLTISYFLGHLIFLVGSYVDPLYDIIRKKRNPYVNESAYQCATRIRDLVLDQSEIKALNNFQWALSVLIQKCPSAAADVHRLEADSKFFRSLLVVFLLAGIVFVSKDQLAQGTISILMGVPCFMRYYERRLKSTTQAYIHIVTAYRLGSLASGKSGGSS